MILLAIPYLSAREELDNLFQPEVTEDRIYKLAMLVHEDDAKAKQLIKVFVESR